MAAVVADDKPILVTGSHRCGSTWVGQVLALSSRIGYILEPFHLAHRPGVCAAKFPNWYQYVCADNEAEFGPPLDRTLGFRYSPMAELGAITRPTDALRMVRDWSRFTRHRMRRSRPLVKDPIAFFSAPWLAGRYGMEVIVLVRHPAAFASSLKRLDWRFDFRNFARQPLLTRDLLWPWEKEIEEAVRNPPDILAQSALLWSVIYGVTRTLCERHPSWKLIRHEDLSLAPEDGFRALYESLGLEFTEPIARELLAMTSAENPAEAPRGKAHALQRDSRSNVRNWSKRLSGAEITELRRRVEAVSSSYYGDSDW